MLNWFCAACLVWGSTAPEINQKIATPKLAPVVNSADLSSNSLVEKPAAYGIEQACEDRDGDGYLPQRCGGNDCDDSDPERFQGNPEQADNGLHDEDCDAFTTGDGWVIASHR